MHCLRLQIVVFTLIFFLGCAEKRKYHDEGPTQTQMSSKDPIQDVLDFQKELNREYKDPKTSPLPDRFRKNFDGLEFFAPDTNYRIRALFVRTPDAVPFLMPTTTNRQTEEVVFGIAHFSMMGKNHQLEVYQNKELMKKKEYKTYLFLPFLDKTNGAETYSGGRYIDLSIPEGDTLIIDFNKAYNPYCAYNKKYSCPIVPEVNSIATRVRAGVKAFNP